MAAPRVLVQSSDRAGVPRFRLTVARVREAWHLGRDVKLLNAINDNKVIDITDAALAEERVLELV